MLYWSALLQKVLVLSLPDKGYNESLLQMRKKSNNPLNNTTLTIGGMVIALGTLLYTGFVRGPGWKRTHIGAGVALTGLSLWHASQQAKYARLDKQGAVRELRELRQKKKENAPSDEPHNKALRKTSRQSSG